MADVDDLLQQFIERYESGDPVRPGDVLAQVEGTERRELETLLDAYLERAPRRQFSAEAFAASPARPLVDDLAQSLEGIAGTWPVVLPRLRTRARLRRSELVTRLAAALGVSDREAKVAGYYHAMEQGELDPAGVSDRVLDALARLTGTTAKALRDAATVLQPGAGPAAAGAPTFARTATPEPEHLASLAAPPTESPAERSDSDLVDELFTGGDVR